MRVAAMGYAGEAPEIDPVAFASEQSILDYDAVIWSPAAIEDEYRDAYTMPGERNGAPMLSVSASVRLLRDVRRRRREIARFLDRGRIMIIDPPPPVPLRVHAIEDYVDFSAFEALPGRFHLCDPPADAPAVFRGGHPFRAYAETIPGRAQVRSTFEQFPGVPLFFTGAQNAVAGGYVYRHPGHLLFMPLPERAGRAVDDALLALLSRIGGTGFHLDLPEWSMDYLVPDEAAARAELRELLVEQETLSRRLEDGRQRVREAAYLKALFASSGRVLLSAIANAFQAFGAIVLPGLLSDDSIVVEDGDRFLVVLAANAAGEVDAAIRLQDCLERFGDTFFGDAKGVVVHSRCAPPQTGVVNEMMAAQLAAAGQVYMTGYDLLHLATSSSVGQSALDRIFAAHGRPAGLPDADEVCAIVT